MFSEKLFSLLLTFSKYELNRFRKFLLSPYYNEQTDVVRLFDVCNECIRKGKAAVDNARKDVVWYQLFPEDVYDDTQLRRLASDLTQLGLRFLAAETRSEEPHLELLDLQKKLEQLGLEKHLASTERLLNKYFEGLSAYSAHTYFAVFQKDWNVFNRASKMVGTADYIEKLLLADFHLECAYIIQKLKFYASWLVFKGIRTTERSFDFAEGLWAYSGHEKFKNVPLIAIYRQIILCLTEPEEELHYRELMADLEKYSFELTDEDLRECFHIAQNYSAFKINQGQTEYYREVFLIFKNIIQRGILLDGGILQEGVYKNIITASLRIQDFDWAENFIREYSAYLPANIRENALTFNLANLYSHTKQYDKVVELLQNVEYSDVVYALGAKLILLRTYYEKQETLALDSLIDSFRIFLRRNKVISKKQQIEYNNFLGFVKKLTSIHPSDQKSLAELKHKVQETSSATPKKWLLEKIEALEKK